ncbi:C3HC zinc finger-like-domain-containing protein [Cladochytrium replicatum]|nr:C3HC zinc finger-like-domain-containing protein [Cladochytrium replicatum]
MDRRPVTFSAVRKRIGELDQSVRGVKRTIEISDKRFEKRLRTYKESTWFGKPDEISPVHCASYGWSNISFDTLECESCKNLLIVKADDSWLHLAFATVALKAYVIQLHESHASFCPWKVRKLGARVPKFPVLSCSGYLDALNARYQTFLDDGDALTGLPELSLPPDLTADQIEQLERKVALLQSDSEERKLSRPVLLLALFGWESCSSAAAGVRVHKDCVECRLCLRQIGMWNFAGALNDGATVGDTLQSFDLVHEHRWYCPWIHEDPAGWNRTVQTILKPERISNPNLLPIGRVNVSFPVL